MAHLYFTDDDVAPGTREATLIGDEARHAVQVARVRVGESFDISDGKGARAVATVSAATTSLVRCVLGEVTLEPEPPVRMVLAQALAKGDRDELAIQTATELGVDVVVPWQSERSVSRWSGDKVAKGIARWRSIVKESAKQAMRSRIPAVLEPASTSTVLTSVPGATWLVLDPGATLSLTEWARTTPAPSTIGLIVGPEGGITPSELDTLVAGGATPVRHGPHVMRTSSAGPAALSALGSLIRDW